MFGCSGSLDKPFLLAHVTHTKKKCSNNNSARESRESFRLLVVPITWSFQMYRFFVTDGLIWKLHVVHTCAEGKKCPKIVMHVQSSCCCYSVTPGTAKLRRNNPEHHRKPLY